MAKKLTVSTLENSLRRVILDDPIRHRTALLLTMEGLLDGTMDIPRANAMAVLSSEVHKSLRNEFSSKIFATKSLALGKSGVSLVENSVEAEILDDDDSA